jgi:DNA-binding response OmpR family regulator
MFPEAPKTGEQYRILVVEDDASIGRLVTSSLIRGGFDCHLVPDGNVGLAAFHEINPHLVISDVMLPGMDGRELCALIRQRSNVPIIMLTADDTEEDQMQALQTGADDYVPKPFHLKELLVCVMFHLGPAYHYDEAIRNAYHYDKAIRNAAGVAHARHLMPPGWARCGGCGYVGPRPKFEQQDTTGQPFLQCPACRQGNRVRFPPG